MTQKELNKQISMSTIEVCGYERGKQKKGKGIEIFMPNSFLVSGWREDIEKDIFLKKIKKIIKEKNLRYRDLIVDSFYNKEKKKYLEKRDMPSIKDIIEGKGLKSCSEIYLYKKGKFLGYIPLSHYDSSRESQMNLAKELIRLEGKEIYGDLDDYDETEEFCRSYHNRDIFVCGDYEQIHGECYYTFDSGDCEYFDGRLEHTNNYRLNDFWMCDELTEDGWFDEVDPDDKYTIFHRKGKDFYVSPSLEEENIEIAFWDGTIEEYNKERNYQGYNNCWNAEAFNVLTYTEYQEVENKLLDTLKNKKEQLEDECYIYNELKLGNPAEECFDYNDKVFDTFLLKNIFEDKWEARNYVFENLNWNKDIKEACQEINLKLLCDFVTFNIDGTMIVKSYQNESIIKLTKLKNLKRLQSRFGYKLVWSRVPFSQEEQMAIKVGDEEYHFSFEELFDEDIRLVDFIDNALSAIQRRMMIQKAKEHLKEHADKVFVGFEDSLQAGNCVFGTEDFCKRHQIDTSKIGAIRGDVILEMEKSVFTERAVIQAIINHKKGDIAA